MGKGPTLLWFRSDLRLEDNPALQAAARRGHPVIPVFIWDPETEAPWKPGAASRWWLHYSLKSLDQELRKRKSRLIVRSGKSRQTIESLVKETGSDAVYFNRRYEFSSRKLEETISRFLKKSGLKVESFNSNLLWEPWEIKTKTSTPFQVFTSFYKAALSHDKVQTLAKTPAWVSPRAWPSSLKVEALKLLPKVDWASGLRKNWKPGSGGAKQNLKKFLAEALRNYSSHRDWPDTLGTSRLSPYLHFGEIGPRQIWQAAQEAVSRQTQRGMANSTEVYLKELTWREFAYHLLYHFPYTSDRPLREKFNKFPWKRNKRLLKAWQRGRTGYPLVDAGMRELWTTGWMHNRVRMVAASFLVKDLLIPWQEGAKWFWDTLVDADLANNSLGWQWTAGCGADAAPFFRIFNPVLQGRKFDPQGNYVKRWLPELEKLSPRWLHCPWEAPKDVLKAANVILGQDYPFPVVDHGQRRKDALGAFKRL